MTRRILISLLLLIVSAGSAHANGWCFSLSGSQSISDLGLHGSGLDASLLATFHPHQPDGAVLPAIGIGVETGTAYMRDSPGTSHSDAAGVGTIVGGYTDGITRNRGYYAGPALRLGESFYVIGSTGVYAMSGSDGRAPSTRWGSSIGLGLSGVGRRESAAELRLRFAPGLYTNATTLQFGLGMHFR